MEKDGMGDIRQGRPRRLWACLALLGASPLWAASAFDCASHQCGLQRDGSYPNVVVGTIRQIGAGKESERVFRWARQRGWWQALPNDPARFAKTVRPVALRTQTPAGSPIVTGLMGDDEFQTAPLQVGDLVRYSPHDKNHERPAEDTPAAWAYWKLYGCIQVLCRARDKDCMSRYRPGIYNRDTGELVDLKTDKPIPGGVAIDPVSYLPKPAVSAQR